MYHYANRPGKSTERSRETIDRFFNTSINGIPGNDGGLLYSYSPIITLNVWVDGGAMGSYVVFYLAGMYPLPATKQMLISSPYFESISFANPLTNSNTTIQSNNFGDGNIYVQASSSSPFFQQELP
jgi:putative alpha-1,2-mannosidase